MWYNEFNGAFFISLATIVIGSIAVCVRYSFKSKCTRVNCFCLECIRNVEVEEDIERMRPNQSQNTL